MIAFEDSYTSNWCTRVAGSMIWIPSLGRAQSHDVTAGDVRATSPFLICKYNQRNKHVGKRFGGGSLGD